LIAVVLTFDCVNMSRYTEAHKNPTGPGDARPTALQIVKDEGYLGKMTNKVRVAQLA
jgi:hypothetical protein